MTVYILTEEIVNNQLGVCPEEYTEICSVYQSKEELIKDATRYVDEQYEFYKEELNTRDFWMNCDGFEGNSWNYFCDYEYGDYRTLKIVARELI